MASTENTTVGIKAIKISKTDALGNDQTLQLQEGELLSLVFSDLGVQRFTITSITEYSDYYLYYVTPTSLGNNESDFNVPEDVSGTGTGVINAGNYELQGTGGGLINGKRFADFDSFTDNTNWTFTNSSGIFSETIGLGGRRFGITVNYEVNVYTDSSTPGITFGIAPSGSGYLVTYNNDVTSTRPDDVINGNTVSLRGGVFGPGNTRTIRGSFNIVASNTTTNFGIIPISYYSGAKFYFPTSSISLNITSLTTSSIDVDGLNTVIEPYITENLSIDDYNATMNNAVVARPNNFYMDVDYSSNSIVAVNKNQIIEGDARKATVQQSNYTLARQTYPRYLGSKNISPDFNQSYGAEEPSVESDGVFFAYFDWVGGTSYELTNKAGFHVKYLIDLEGNTISPNISGSYYYNIINTFNANKNNVNVLFQAGETAGNVDNLIGTHPVIRSAAQARAVLFSQTGSTQNTLTSMSFSDPSGFVSSLDYTTNTSLSPDIVSVGTTTVLDIASTIFSGSDAVVSTGGNYITLTNNGAQVAPKVSLTMELNSINNFDGIGTLTFERSTNGGTSWESTAYDVYQFPLEDKRPLTLAYTAPYENAVSSLAYRVKFTFSITGGGGGFVDYSGTFGLAQSPPNVGTVSSPYWTTGSSSSNVLTGSKFTSDIYGLTQDPVYNENNPASGSAYDRPGIPFVVNVGDQIRFGGDESVIYEVVNVDPPESNVFNDLFLTLNKPVPSSTNINSFMIRTYVDNPNFVLVDALKDSNTGGGSGFLLPEYTSQTILDKFDDIVKDLTEKGLI